MKKTIFVLTALALTALPAGVPGFVHWSAGELKASAAKLGPKADTVKAGEAKVASEPLGSWGNHSSALTVRRNNGEAELHEKVVDYFFAQSGEATLIVGGKVIEPRTTGPGEIRGKGIEGGEKHPLKPGDIVHIPANTPHQVLVAKEFVYYMIKVQQ
jgi:mannose-6-phosphate isomerase-like protein (cupin superfamily)